MGGGRSPGVPVTIVTGVLLLAGLLEVAALSFKLAARGVFAVAGLPGPALLLPFTAAALLAAVGGRSTRIAACFGAALALLVRLGLLAVPLVPGARVPGYEVFNLAAGAVTGIGLFGFTLLQVLRHRDLSDQPLTGAPARPAAHAAPQPRRPAPGSAPASAPVGQRRLPESPSTPVDVGLRSRGVAPGGRWATASTPWPRANEDDPNGTLIRPPRR